MCCCRQQYIMYIDSSNRNWYYTLKQKDESVYGERKALFDHISRDSIVTQNKLLIQAVNIDNKYIFTVFNNFLNFYTYQNKIAQENRCFFETVLGEKPQKLYFDIDIKIVPNSDNAESDPFSDNAESGPFSVDAESGPFPSMRKKDKIKNKIKDKIAVVTKSH